MKKLRIIVNGRQYEVDVEILHDDDNPSPMPQMYGNPYQPAGFQPAPQQMYQPAPVAAPAPAPVAAPAPAPKAAPVAAGANDIASPINGVVLEVPVKVGDAVTRGQIVVVLEAMKMKTNVAATADGTVKSINVKVNDNVDSGSVLITLG